MQAPRIWYEKMDTILTKSRFSRCFMENNVYVQRSEHVIIIVLYVDDKMLTWDSDIEIEHMKTRLKNTI